MKPRHNIKPRYKRLALLGGVLSAVGVVVALVLNAFQSNMVFFYSPTQVVAKEAPNARAFRIGVPSAPAEHLPPSS